MIEKLYKGDFPYVFERKTEQEMRNNEGRKQDGACKGNPRGIKNTIAVSKKRRDHDKVTH